MVCSKKASGPRHVPGDDRWISGNILAEMARQQASVDVGGAGRRIPDDEADCLVLVKSFDGLSICRGRSSRHCSHEKRYRGCADLLQHSHRAPLKYRELSSSQLNLHLYDILGFRAIRTATTHRSASAIRWSGICDHSMLRL